LSKHSLAIFPSRIARGLSGYLLSLSLCLLTVSAAAQIPFSSNGIGIGQAEFLPVDQAFRFYTAKPRVDELTIHWDIAPGYYLYQDKFTFIINGETLIPALPEAQQHSDEFFGDVKVYYQQITATIALPEALQRGRVDLEIQFQGCAEAGLCYPPQRKTLALDL
jgi:thiol:disulfide interchange protein